MEGLGLTDAELELLDPHPDIHSLFVHYNSLYFGDSLGACSVEWSSGRMTLCGGVCEWRPGGGCRIKLSEPLLKLRPSRDLKMVLLHEMIHAHLMLQGIRDDDPGGHGTAFKAVMARINASTAPDHQRPPGGYQITVTHSMLAEVEHYRQHHWRCERCSNVVKRAMNRPPQEADCRGRTGRGAACADPYCRFHMHAKHCGGAWIKVKEPEGYQGKKKKKSQGAGGNPGSTAGDADAEGGSRVDVAGAAVPAKRPKKAGVPGPSAAGAAAAGSRPITDFFPRRVEGPPAASAAADPAGAVLPAIQAVTEAATGSGQAQPPSKQQQAQQQQAQQQQQKQQHVQQQQAQQQQAQQQQQKQQHVQQQQQHGLQGPEPSPEERRRLLADAALRRLAASASGASGGTGDRQQGQPVQAEARHTCPAQQQQQQERQGKQEQHRDQLDPEQQQQQCWNQDRQQEEQQGALPPSPGYVDLVWSSSDEEAQPPTAAPATRDSGAAPSAPANLKQQGPAAGPEAATVADPTPSRFGALPTGRSGGSPGGGDGPALLECPMCGRRWGDGEISNTELNAHVDECLNLLYLKDAA